MRLAESMRLTYDWVRQEMNTARPALFDLIVDPTKYFVHDRMEADDGGIEGYPSFALMSLFVEQARSRRSIG
jgi:hypothetical protein